MARCILSIRFVPVFLWLCLPPAGAAEITTLKVLEAEFSRHQENSVEMVAKIYDQRASAAAEKQSAAKARHPAVQFEAIDSDTRQYLRYRRSDKKTNDYVDIDEAEDKAQEWVGDKAWRDIKTSLKKVNSQWNRLDYLLNRFIAENGTSVDLAIFDERYQTPADEARQSALAHAYAATLRTTPEDADYGAAQAKPSADSSVIGRILHYFSLTGLLELLSGHAYGIAFIGFSLLLAVAGRGVIKFYRFRSRRKRKVRKDRAIDGIINH